MPRLCYGVQHLYERSGNKAGFAVYGIDYTGHGKSSRLHGYIFSFDDLVNDCSDHFTNISEKEKNRRKMRILMGESRVGAVVLLLHRKKPGYWSDAVLMAPMCKTTDEILKPSLLMTNVLITKLSHIIPKWKIIPTEDVIDKAFRLPHIRKEIRNSPLCYKGRPFLKTGYHLLTVSMDLEKRLAEVSLPFMVVHGGDDKVTDPTVSKVLFEKLYDSAVSKVLIQHR